MTTLLVRIEADLCLVSSWDKIDDPNLTKQGAVGYGGKGKAWQFFVVGSRKDEVCMAAATRRLHEESGVVMADDPHVVNLPPELAAKAYELATKAAK